MASASNIPITTSRRPALAGIGERLREMFDTMTAGPSPPHLLDLVDQLEAQAEPRGEAQKRPALNPA